MTTNLADDGYKWQRDVISNPGAWMLADPEGHCVAHAYRNDDRTWCAVWCDGEVIANGLPDCGAALKAVDNVARPCAYVDTNESHGIVPCDNDREPGSVYCAPHRAKTDAEEAVVA